MVPPPILTVPVKMPPLMVPSYRLTQPVNTVTFDGSVLSITAVLSTSSTRPSIVPPLALSLAFLDNLAVVPELLITLPVLPELLSISVRVLVEDVEGKKINEPVVLFVTSFNSWPFRSSTTFAGVA